MKAIWESLRKHVGLWCIALLLGFIMGKSYTQSTIITDCKVLGMTRFGDVPMGCRVGEKSQ